MVGILRSLWRDSFVINPGALVISLRLINWKAWIGRILDRFARPQICIPYDQTGLNMNVNI